MAELNATAQQTTEQPQLEVSNEGPGQSKGGADDVQELIQTLGKIGVNKPEQIAKLHQEASSAGQLANYLGETRKYATKLENKISSLEGQIQQLVTAQGGTYHDTTQNAGPINVDAAVERALFKVADTLSAQQRQAYAAVMRQRQEIEADEDYSVIQPFFEKHMTNPDVQVAINLGQTTYEKEYNKVTKSFYRSIAKRSKEALETVQKGRITPPHMESAESQATPSVATGSDDIKAKLREISKKSTGTDQTVDDMLDAMFKKGDPFFQTGR